ncbi:hypothetical protein [Pseudomonas sp. NPDC087029]|uniref:hypothetical protein n=1 Tax=Pseudomonas sp. NPDC087029 TaxID=3364433 RepID=UPI0038182D38
MQLASTRQMQSHRATKPTNCNTETASPLHHANSVVNTPYEVTNGATIEVLPEKKAEEIASAPAMVDKPARTLKTR